MQPTDRDDRLVWLPTDLYRRLRELAAEAGMTVDQLVEAVLSEAVKE